MRRAIVDPRANPMIAKTEQVSMRLNCAPAARIERSETRGNPAFRSAQRGLQQEMITRAFAHATERNE
jgi:hypothetical protein